MVDLSQLSEGSKMKEESNRNPDNVFIGATRRFRISAIGEIEGNFCKVSAPSLVGIQWIVTKRLFAGIPPFF